MKTFPRMMRSDSGLVVLFSQERVGMVLVANPWRNVGYYSDSWNMTKFTDYVDSLTLYNPALQETQV